ncbi:hypothetical protein [Glycomyces sp. YM15]|uniref:hypothetical protein n=1 Tax=Glycomyces sp. YM15 TaxID=2800446 RepID=UPI0019635C4C|nr:hypothetical protein [Glycomyces sp. YM15]
MRERGFAGDGPTEKPDLDVEIALGQAIDRARQQLLLLEAVRVRFYRQLVDEAPSPAVGQKILKELHVRDDAWQEMQVEDFRRFGPLA